MTNFASTPLDSELVGYLRDRFAQLLIADLDLRAERGDFIRSSIAIEQRTDATGRFIEVIFTVTGYGYCHYVDLSDRNALDEFIDDVAREEADNYRAERVERTTDVLDPERSWLEYVEDARWRV